MTPTVRTFVLGTALLVALGPSRSLAQETTKTAAPAQAPAPAPAQEDYAPDYQIGPGDLLSIKVSGVSDFDYSTRVSNSARIRVPYVGIMFVAGMTAVEVEREIERLIKLREFVNDPSVRVQIVEHRARPTYVIGEVTAPGQFVITGEMYLLDLLSKAGDLLSSASSTGFLYRRNPPSPAVDARMLSAMDLATPAAAASADTGEAAQVPKAVETGPEEVIPIDFVELKKGLKPELNLQLRGGDVLYVPRRKPNNFYIIGDVKAPGAYTLPRIGRVSAAQAMIYAGGPLATAKMGKSFLMRHDAAGKREAVPVNFSAILHGEAPDFQIQANDIIFVPTSNIKTIGVGLLNLVPRLVQQYLIF